VPQTKSWAALRGYIASVLMDPSIKTEAAKIQLWNGSGLPGIAGNATTMLNDLGFQMLPPQNLDTSVLQQTEVHDLSGGRDTSTVNYLASLFAAKVVTDAPTAADQADIKVILGKSFQQSASTIDSYDPTTRLMYGAPAADAVQPVQVTVKPSASVAPIVRASAAASGATSVNAGVRPSQAAAVVTTGGTTGLTGVSGASPRAVATVSPVHTPTAVVHR